MSQAAPWLRMLSCLLFLACLPAGATTVAPKSLEELVPQAEVVVVATIFDVDVVDARGRQLQGELARTGPGLDNRMRLHLQVEEAITGSGSLFMLYDLGAIVLWVTHRRISPVVKS